MAPESRDEVRQRIDSLYDRAENATGNYNATRAMTTGTRGRGVPLRKKRSAETDPDLDRVTRQWFDAARTRLGPTVPAVLPADRRPGRPAESRPKGPSEDEPRGGGRESTGRRTPELPAGPAGRALGALPGGPVAELTAGSARPELPAAARPVAALPAVPGPRREPDASEALPARTGEPRRRPTPGTAKEQNRRKLAAARDLLSSYSVRRTGRVRAIETRPADPGMWSGTESAARQRTEEEWRPPSWAVGLGVARPSATDTPRDTTDALGLPQPLSSYDPLGMPDPLGMSHPPGTPPTYATPDTLGRPDPLDASGPLGTSGPLGWSDPLGTPDPLGPPAAFAVPDPSGAGSLVEPGPVAASYAVAAQDTGTFLTTALTDTGSFAAVGVGTGSAPEALYGDKAGKAVAFARAQIGRPCLWGATGPDSYDYASLAQAAWRAAGVALPRSAREQADAGTPVALTDIRDGDLVFFFENDSHVGLYVGNGMMVHAPGPGSLIREESIFGAGRSAIHRVIRPA